MVVTVVKNSTLGGGVRLSRKYRNYIHVKFSACKMRSNLLCRIFIGLHRNIFETS